MQPRKQTIHLGALSGTLRHAARHLVEVVLAPLGLFYLVLTLTNLTGGLLAALGLADDFCAFPAALTGNPRVQRFFRRVSLLWALVFLTNGAATLWVLARATLGDFLIVTTAGSFTLVGVAALASLLWFRRELRGEGIRLRFGPASAA